MWAHRSYRAWWLCSKVGESQFWLSNVVVGPTQQLPMATWSQVTSLARGGSLRVCSRSSEDAVENDADRIEFRFRDAIWILILIYGSLRFDDGKHVSPSSLTLERDALYGLIWQTKVERKRKGTRFAVPKCSVSGADWFSIGWDGFSAFSR